MTILNTIMAKQLQAFRAEVEKLSKGGESKEGAILRVLRQYITDSRKILFEGDNYSEAWAKEAKKRGLNNVKTTPHALDFFVTKKAREVLVGQQIFSEKELEARYEIMHHNYVLKIDIEARIMADMVINSVIPSAIGYMNKLAENLAALKAAGLAASAGKAQKELLAEINGHVNAAKEAVDQMNKAIDGAHKVKHTPDVSKYYCEKVKPFFDIIRRHSDAIEKLVDDESWPLPKYREILFMK
jgi:glutamine synthetase